MWSSSWPQDWWCISPCGAAKAELTLGRQQHHQLELGLGNFGRNVSRKIPGPDYGIPFRSRLLQQEIVVTGLDRNRGGWVGNIGQAQARQRLADQTLHAVVGADLHQLRSLAENVRLTGLGAHGQIDLGS